MHSFLCKGELRMLEWHEPRSQKGGWTRDINVGERQHGGAENGGLEGTRHQIEGRRGHREARRRPTVTISLLRCCRAWIFVPPTLRAPLHSTHTILIFVSSLSRDKSNWKKPLKQSQILSRRISHFRSKIHPSLIHNPQISLYESRP